MSEKNVSWAKKHDWFISAYEVGGRFIILVKSDDCRIRAFDNLSKMKEWAGY